MSLEPRPDDKYVLRARSDSAPLRLEVARDPAAPPEILYYLASDVAEDVRIAVAENITTPPHAGAVQLRDSSIPVRAALARKLGRILPKMGEGATRAVALQTLEALCADTASSVREMVAVTLQDTSFLPPKLAIQLAEDSERAVAMPVLRFCLSLSDDDLVGLIKRSRREWVPVEIAHRKSLSNNVALSIWESGNSEAATVLLAHQQAQTPALVLDEATDEAAVVTCYQAPLVRHPALQPAQMTRLASFIDSELLDILAKRIEPVRGEASDAVGVIRRRMEWRDWRKQGGTESARARALHEREQLDDAALSDAIACGERAFVVTALALLAKTDEGIVGKILEHQSPKGITALCWKAGISMRVCRQVQIRTARVPYAKALNARGGFDYPLEAVDIRWQLEFYGIHKQ
jgi:uncharacterized protein (DUF2336 family)